MKIKKIILVLTFLAIAAVSVASDPNLVRNPGFEISGLSGWLNYDFGSEFGRNYSATDQKHGGKQSLKLWATGKTNDPKKWEMSGTKQEFLVKPGDVISGGAWLKWENLKDVEAFIECKWLDGNRRELGPGIGTEHKTTGSGGWEYQDLNKWTTAERTAPKGAAFVDFRLTLLSAGKADIATGTVWWDDAQFMIEKK